MACTAKMRMLYPLDAQRSLTVLIFQYVGSETNTFLALFSCVTDTHNTLMQMNF